MAVASETPSLSLKMRNEDDADEDSFEILSQEPSMQPTSSGFFTVEDEKLKSIVESLKKEVENNNTQMNSMPVMVSPTLSSSSLQNFESTHEELQELIKENEALKSTLQQTNLSMKTNLEKIMLWKAEVNRVFEVNKEKVEELKLALDKSNEMNGKMQMEVEKYKQIKEVQDEELLHLKSELMQTSGKTAKVENESFCMVDTELLRKENAKLHEEIVKLQNQDLKQIQEELKQKEESIAELKDHISKASQVRDTEKILKDEEIAKLRKENEELKEKLIEQQQKHETVLNEQEKRHSELYEPIKAENEELKNKLQINSTKISEFEALKVENDNLNALKSDFEDKILLINQQLISAQEVITESNEKLSANKEQIDKMEKDLLEHKNAADDMFALKEQLEIYKADFEIERQARENVVSQKNQLEEDLLNIQRRNQQLQAEIDTMRGGFVVVPPPAQEHRRSDSQSDANSTSSSSPKLTRFSCPMCNLQFRSFRLVQEHVEHCTGTPFTDN